MDRILKLFRSQGVADPFLCRHGCFFFSNMDVDLYEQDCEFADPFVSFRGTDRFKKNLENLGPFMEDVKLQLTKFEVQQPGEAPDLVSKEMSPVITSRPVCVVKLWLRGCA